jgi:hypothetical protein
MNIQAIKSIVNDELTTDEIKRHLIVNAMAMDQNVIPDVMKILEAERKRKKELITEMNHELSRAHTYIDSYTESERAAKNNCNKSFIMDQIAKFYFKFSDQVTHCYNRFQ